MDSLKTIFSENNINFIKNEDLSKHSTMRVGGKADIFIQINSIEELQNAVNVLKESEEKFNVFILGEGSNTLFTGDFNGVVVKINLKGIETVEENDSEVTLKAAAGENWHEFVKYCVDRNYAGNENLAFIPGTIGAAPVQNIAAYGQVQEDTFVELEALNLKTGELKTFNKSECEFAYRTSIFKKAYAGEFVITSVTYKLQKVSDTENYVPETSYHSRYESLMTELQAISKGPYSLKDVFNAVVSIRTKKLPLVSEYGTLGSFFVNPFITKQHLEKLQEKFPGIQFYPVDKMQYPDLSDPKLKDAEVVKIPAGWLLEELGWKGKMVNNVGTYSKHALCVITNGPATGKEVIDFMNAMKADVKEKTGIELQSEVNII
jgi:UDP-N-acetylmuramate dehydrogenase